ncbi:hypothetical protein Tco_1102937 [Tanacetum coccineum]
MFARSGGELFGALLLLLIATAHRYGNTTTALTPTSIDNTSNKEKVKIVSLHLSDKALLWHRQYLSVNGENISWEEYKNAIIQRFESIFEDPMSSLKNAKYEKNAKEYQDLDQFHTSEFNGILKFKFRRERIATDATRRKKIALCMAWFKELKIHLDTLHNNKFSMGRHVRPYEIAFRIFFQEEYETSE